MLVQEIDEADFEGDASDQEVQSYFGVINV